MMKSSQIHLEMMICEFILEFDKPFKVSTVIKELERKGVSDQTLILRIIDQLCDSGHLKYSEVDNDEWAYKKTLQYA